ncbi:MAG: hypothetical protein E6R03_16185 [Hyphomicrobiaceae bacterium]|nr:MAG: hypothetical protein E6R03_16185 [Hyphomicrobiaceae bacterium]
MIASDHPMLALVGLLSTTATTVAMSVAPSADEWEAIGRLPVIIVLGLVCCWLSWLLYKQGVDHRLGDDAKTEAMLEASKSHAAATIEISKAVANLTAELRLSPCVVAHRDQAAANHKR